MFIQCTLKDYSMFFHYRLKEGLIKFKYFYLYKGERTKKEKK